MYLAIGRNECLFAIFLIINLITDALEGIIARVFRMQTELGARLDAFADVGMYISAITGVLVFKAADFSAHLLSLYVYIGVFAYFLGFFHLLVCCFVFLDLVSKNFKRLRCLSYVRSMLSGNFRGIVR